MFYMSLIFIVISMFGFFWTLFGSAMIAILYYIFTFKFLKFQQKKVTTKKISFEVLIAAYNEEVNLPFTLESLEELKIPENLDFKVYVGLDHCTDGTLKKVNESIEKKNLKLRYFENQGERGKWFIIKQLILKSDADWVALTDCGAVWNNEVLISAMERFYDLDLICLAPSYLPDRAGVLETTYWRMEQFLRTIENIGKGSIMVHGPTVFYKRSSLLLAIELLGQKHWINDDVAIPLVLRNYNHEFKIEYFASLKHTAWIRDKGVVSDVNIELKRRRRILIGNIQCVVDIIFPKFNILKLISWTSLRLVAKLLWAYWITFFMVGIIFLGIDHYKLIFELFKNDQVLMYVAIAFLISLILVSIKSNYVHRLFMAYRSGLQLNKAIKALENPKKIVWS